MTDKKPATRDISALKARLGLNKGPVGRPGVAPPGAAAPVPPPPGMAGVAPSPFAAMEQASDAPPAAVAYTPPPPEYIIINDGKPVEQVSQSGKILGRVKTGVMVAAPLFVGYVLGGINTGNHQWNGMVESAKPVYDSFNKVKKDLDDLSSAVAKWESDDKVPSAERDPELAKALQSLAVKAPEEAFFDSKLYALPESTAHGLVTFYSDYKGLTTKVDEHAAITLRDAKKSRGANQIVMFGALLHMPKPDEPKPPWFEIVELGEVKCADGKLMPAQPGCPVGAAVAQQYRTSPTQVGANGVWQRSTAVAAPAAPLADMTIVPFAAAVGGEVNQITQALFVGAETWLDAYGHRLRIGAIIKDLKDLAERRKSLQDQMNSAAQRGVRITVL